MEPFTLIVWIMKGMRFEGWGSASAGACKVTGWSERQPGQHPIFTCPDGKTVG